MAHQIRISGPLVRGPGWKGVPEKAAITAVEAGGKLSPAKCVTDFEV